MNVLVLLAQGDTLVHYQVLLQVLLRVVLGVQAADGQAQLPLLGRIILEDIILRHVYHRVGVILENHSIGVQLLDRLNALAVAVGKLLLVGVAGHGWELKHLVLRYSYEVIKEKFPYFHRP